MKNKIIRLNIGCGETKLQGFINIDVEKKVKPDLKLDITKSTLPFKEGVVSQINLIHNLEHIQFKFWPPIFSEFHRVLKYRGRLLLAYPEFSRCAARFMDNTQGMRDFWRATLYGRQAWKGDFHVVPMDTFEIVDLLQQAGFDPIKYGPEADEPYNTFLVAYKGVKPPSKEDVVRKSIFNK